jgi:hypothetical protein
VVIYYGMADTVCDYVSGYAMASAIPWSGQQGFSDQPLTSLLVSEVPAGQTKTYNELTFMQVLIRHDALSLYVYWC